MAATSALVFFALGIGLAAAQDQVLREAARLDTEQKCGEAEHYYQQALARGAPSPALLNNLGNHYLVCGQPEKAARYFEQLLELNPEHANANLQMARLETARKRGAEALAYLARVKDAGPAVRLLRAEASYYAGRHAAAQATLDTLEKTAGGDLRILFAIGITCARIGLYDRAEASFQVVAAAHPENFDVLFNLGRAAARARHYDRAERALEVVVRLQPGDPDALLELGLVEAARKNYSRAVYVLAQARKIAPKRPDILLALARAAEDAGYYGDSALAYDEYLEAKPSDDGARRDRARVYGLTGTRRNKGIEELRAYLGRHPEDPIGYYDLAQLCWSDNPQEALQQLSKALRLDPNYAPAYYARAWLLQRLGRLGDSLPDLQAAARLMPGSTRALDQLGLAYLSLDQPAQAEKILRRAVRTAPEDPEVVLHLGRALMALDREQEAQPFLDKFQKLRPRQVRDPHREAGLIELATLSSAERTERAIERLRRDARTHPSDPQLQLSLASLLLADGRRDEAMDAFHELLTRNAAGPIQERAGKTLLAVGQYALAREFLEHAGAPLDLAIARFFIDGPQSALQAIEKVPEGEQAGDYLLMKARILDAAGQSAEAEKVLQEGLRRAASRPEVVQQAAMLLVRHKRNTEALDLLGRAGRADPDNADLLLAKAIVLGLMERTADAERVLNGIESRWPEWDRAYLAHGLIVRTKHPAEAARKLRTARVLRGREIGKGCSLERLLFTGCKGDSGT
jgi:tetratricopeptide (TPR) repeat protein